MSSLTIRAAFAASVWINDIFLDTIGTMTSEGDANGLFTFPPGSVKEGRDNVITVLLDHMGNDEGKNREQTRFYRLSLEADRISRKIRPWHPRI